MLGFFFTLPVGMGLKQVLLISASKSDSYHIFKAPAAPAPKAMANNEIEAFKNEICTGAISKPTILVNNTNDITRGFIRLKNDLKLKILVFFICLIFATDELNLFYFWKLFKSMKRRW